MDYKVVIKRESLVKFASLHFGRLEGTIINGALTVLIAGRRRMITWDDTLIIDADGTLSAHGDHILCRELVAFLTHHWQYECVTLLGPIVSDREKVQGFADAIQLFDVRVVAFGQEKPGRQAFMCYLVNRKNDQYPQPALLIIDGTDAIQRHRAFCGDQPQDLAVNI